MSLDWMPLEQHDFVVGGQAQHFASRALSNSIHRQAGLRAGPKPMSLGENAGNEALRSVLLLGQTLNCFPEV